MNLKYIEKKRKKEELKRRLMYSVIAGLMAAVLLAPMGNRKTVTPAWWGTLYPEYCYSQGTENESGDDREVRIRFRWLHGL